MNLKKLKIRDNIQDLNMLHNLELQLQKNKRISLPELSNFNHNDEVEFNPIHTQDRQGGARGGSRRFGQQGVQWHELSSLDNIQGVDQSVHREIDHHPPRRAIT